MANTVTRSTITVEAAQKMIAAAEAKAAEIKRKMVIAICDDGGNLKAFSRMDGAPLLSVEIAQNKAYTAVSFGVATHQWFDFIKDDPPLLYGITHTPRLTVFGGGFPVVIKAEMIGAIGLSGGHYTQDMECARAALVTIGADPL